MNWIPYLSLAKKSIYISFLFLFHLYVTHFPPFPPLYHITTISSFVSHYNPSFHHLHTHTHTLYCLLVYEKLNLWISSPNTYPLYLCCYFWLTIVSLTTDLLLNLFLQTKVSLYLIHHTHFTCFSIPRFFRLNYRDSCLLYLLC